MGRLVNTLQFYSPKFVRPFFGGTNLKNNHSLQNINQPIQSIVLMINEALKNRNHTLVVAFDGGSGSGKSTLATEVALSLGATIIQCDDFFNNTIPDENWDAYSIEKRFRLCIDWERVRVEALFPLLAGKNATYFPYYFSMDKSPSNAVVKESSPIILLDGIYSAYWLRDLVDLKVLVDVPSAVRYNRHNEREGTEDIEWHSRWDRVEDYYFSVLQPPFDIIVENN